MIDPYLRDTPGLSDPASNLIAITPSDTADIAIGIKAIRIWNPAESAATVSIVTAAGSTISFTVPPLSLVVEPVRAHRVRATGTTAGLELRGYTDHQPQA